MANVTRIAILELAFYGVTSPEERRFYSRWVTLFREAVVVLQRKHLWGEQPTAVLRDSWQKEGQEQHSYTHTMLMASSHFDWKETCKIIKSKCLQQW